MTTETLDSRHTTNQAGLYMVRCGYQAELYVVDLAFANIPRGANVLVRTQRGLELAELLGEVTPSTCEGIPSVRFVRGLRPEDKLLWKQLRLLSQEASQACQNFLSEQQIDDVLIEAEPLFDGRTIYFHFLGVPSAKTETFVQELAHVYQQNVSKSRFAELLETGCGPGCGTKEKAGCGTTEGGCAVCAIAGGCTSTRRAP